MTPTPLAKSLQAFFTAYLPMQRNVSAHTIRSYRDMMTLLLRFCRDKKGLVVERLSLVQLDAALIIEFLDFLEIERHCSIRTRNQRLAALHAFVRYVQVEVPEYLLHCQRLLAIPFKRCAQPILQHLSAEQVKAILAQPNVLTAKGRRDLVLLSLLYDSGARVQELIELSLAALRLEAPAQVRLTGKGRKIRIVPLLPNTALLLADYLREHGLDQPGGERRLLFANYHGEHLSRTSIRDMIQKYAGQARHQGTPIPNGISPHTFRHSKAMHMLQAGIPLVIIRDFLGHADITTSEIYARADLDMKRQALEKLTPVFTAPASPSWRDDPSLLAWLQAL
jgi:integrase/recombinase XerD